MSIDFILPDIGEGIVECELVEWLVKEGEAVVEDQPIADVMTDKALVQIPAMHSGIIDKLFYKQGEIAKVHLPLFSMTITVEGVTTKAKGAEVKNTQAKEITGTIQTQESTQQTEQTESINSVNSLLDNHLITLSNSDPGNKGTQVTEQRKTNGKVLASPAVRRIARELNVNINDVLGSGKKGRVYKEDIVSFEQGNSSFNPLVKTSSTRIESHYVKKLQGIKAVMAKAMVASVSTIPHFTYCEEIDMTELIKLRGEVKENAIIKDMMEAEGIKLTMMSFFMKAMSLALKEFPIINSQINEDCTELTYFNDHNIGMAVDSKIGLLVPNVKQVQNKTLLELASDISRLTTDARNGRVKSSDLKGGTITISNIGAIGGTVTTPIINKPEVAIVALGKLQKLPRFNEQGVVEARSIMQVSWSGDHRVIDGGSIARFCNFWKSLLEKPNNMLVHMY
jgi:2-oxoisovalerate dehydrogenase E2 component (dihydrolipoyl transacylase)